MIIVIFGGLGSGKTTFMTYLGYLSYKEGRTIYSNYKLNFPYQKIDFEQILSFQLQNATILLDEGYLYADSHYSSSKINTLITYFVQQSRKRNVDLIITTQRVMNIDKRIRYLVDILIHCEGVKNNGNPDDIRFKFTIVNDGKLKVVYMTNQQAKYIWSLFDTNEIFSIVDIEGKKKLITKKLRGVKNV